MATFFPMNNWQKFSSLIPCNQWNISQQQICKFTVRSNSVCCTKTKYVRCSYHNKGGKWWRGNIYYAVFWLITDTIMRLHDLIWQKRLLFYNSPWQQIYASLKFTNTFLRWNWEIHRSTTRENAVLKTTMLGSCKEKRFNQI